MKQYSNVIAAYSIMIILIILVGIFQSWSIALTILNYCLISAVMTIGANIQWGYAGLINFGIMGYTALGGLAVVLVSVAPVPESWKVGGFNMLACICIIVAIIFSLRYLLKNLKKSFWKFYIEKDIQLIFEGGWHFNNLYNLNTISQKLKVFPHKEFSSKNYSDIEIVKKKIE